MTIVTLLGLKATRKITNRAKRAGKSMSDHATGQKTVFRHGISGKHPHLTIGISLTIFLATCAVAVFNSAYWVLTLLCCLAVLLYSYLAYLKLEIWERGFNHRDLSGNHTFEFGQIDDVFFETVSVGDGYAPVLSVGLKGGMERRRVPIGMFPVQASTLLFTALDRHRIAIHLDGSPLVQNTMRQIRGQ